MLLIWLYLSWQATKQYRAKKSQYYHTIETAKSISNKILKLSISFSYLKIHFHDMTVYPNINASLDCFSKEKCSPLLVPSLYTLLTMEWLQLWVCHCVFFTEWELAVMISMSPPRMPVVDHNSLYSPWNLHWEHLMVPRTTMLAAKPTVRFTFLWAWPSLCYWGKRRLSNRTIYDPAWFWPWASWNAIAQKM